MARQILLELDSFECTTKPKENIKCKILNMSGLKVAIIGANGKIGRLLVDYLKQDKTHFGTPLAIVRNAEQQEYFTKEVKINASLTSIEHASVKEVAAAIKGYDAMVFTAGAGGKGVERLFTVDLDGCTKALEACEMAGVNRFIVVSALKAEDRDFWWDIPGLREYYIAKRAADHDVRHSDLAWTILQPGWLKDEPSIGKFTPLDQIDEKIKGDKSIGRKDVALFIKEALLHEKETLHKTLSLVNGDVPVDEFISTL